MGFGSLNRSTGATVSSSKGPRRATGRAVVAGASLAALVMAGAGCGGTESPTSTERPDDTLASGTVEIVYSYDVAADGAPRIADDLAGALAERLTSLDVGPFQVKSDEPGVLRVTLDADEDVDVDHLIRVVGSAGALRFRPVMWSVPGSLEELVGSSPATAPGPSTTNGAATQLKVTPSDQDVAGQTVVLEELDGDDVAFTYQLGPAATAGQIVSGATASRAATGQESVRLLIREGAGIDAFNAIAAECFAKSAVCPTGQLAVVLDSVVLSAPTVQQPAFEPDQIEISGNFDESNAAELAALIGSGALPVALELQTVRRR